MVRSVPCMPTMTRFAQPKSFRRAAVVALLAATLWAAAAGKAAAEDSQAPGGAAGSAQQAPPPSVPPPPADKPSFLHGLKAWWDDSIAFFGAKLKDTRGTVDDLNKKSTDAAKGVAATTQDAMQGALDVSKGAAVATQGAMKGALDVSKDAATALMRLPNTQVVEVHERCATAPNGAPDCPAAAAAACRGKGFTTGQPLDVRTAEKCDTTQAWQAGQSPGKGECPIESVIIRAVCQ